MLRLSRGTVVEAGPADGPRQRLLVDLGRGDPRRATGEVALVGAAQTGDEVVVNVEAVELGLGSGGEDVVHVNLTRGLDGAGTPGAHVMKLNYTSLQHAVLPVTEGRGNPGGDLKPLVLPLARPAAVFGLHGQLPALAWAFAQAGGGPLGYVQTAGGALPGSLSRMVPELREAGLLAGHLTAGSAYGGADGEAITTAEALYHGLTTLGWAAAAVGPGPGILGSASVLGHGGLAVLDSAHTALALGCPTLVVARLSSCDPRPRHRGVSHHTRTVLDLLLAPVTVAMPGEAAGPEPEDRHRILQRDADLDGYRASGLPTRSMGRDDWLFFASALVSGTTLAELA